MMPDVHAGRGCRAGCRPEMPAALESPPMTSLEQQALLRIDRQRLAGRMPKNARVESNAASSKKLPSRATEVPEVIRIGDRNSSSSVPAAIARELR